MATSQQISYELPDSQALMLASQKAKNDAEFIASMIVDEQSLQLAVNSMTKISKRIKELNDLRLSITRPMDAAKKNVMALFKPAITAYENAEIELKKGISQYKRKRDAELEIARREAEQKAMQEREALLQAAKNSDDEIHSEALIEVAASIVPDAVKAPEKVSGATFVKRWKGRVTDLPAFLRFVADHPEFIDCISVNQGQLNRIISASKGRIKLEGVEAFEEETVQAR